MASDLFKYFRSEARELLEGLNQGVLELEKGTHDADIVANLLRLAHTLKGASRVVKQPAIAELAHGVEDMLSPLREADHSATKEQTGLLLEALDQIGVRLAALDERRDHGGSASRSAAEDGAETLRVEVEEVDSLLRNLSELGSQISAIENELETVRQAHRSARILSQQINSRPEPAGHSALQTAAAGLIESIQRIGPALTAGTERLRREFGQTHETAKCLRLLPAGAIFPPLIRAARDAATTLGKQVEVQTTGGEVRLDAQVLTVMRGALLHLIRNAVAHGIENEDRRTAAGKPVRGRINLEVSRRRNIVTFRCADDGAGIDVEAVRRAAVKQGIISPAAASSLSINEVIKLMLRGGVSTTATVTGISGRGIGLDAVREAVRRLKGETSVETVTGQGTTVDISVPVSATSVTALIVEAAGIPVSIPLDCVCRTLRLADTDIVQSGGRRSIIYEDQAIPLFELATGLGEEPAAVRRRHFCVAVLTSGTARVAVGVDRLLGTDTLIVQAVPRCLMAQPLVGGVSLDGNGNPQLVLHAEGLVRAAAAPQQRRSAPNAPLPVLIVDDSLTTRMVEQGILESAGYAVQTAASAEEALDKARARKYSLFLVDVEMPGMDGFELVSRICGDPSLRDTPAILVTSRSSAEDRRRGKLAGARAYIVKSEFDQGRFLQTVEELVNA
jgi:two-component system chemotaxis sensor kinase CheA